MSSPFSEARKRQLARLGGAKPPTARAAIAIAKSQAYQDAADAPSTLRAYTADLANYEAWCKRHGFEPMPATPEIVGAYLAAAGEGYALPTLRRRVAAIARACGVAGHPLDTKHPAIRETLRGIARKHGAPARRSAALTTTEVKKLSRACGTDLAGARDRALFLVGFAGAMRRSELVALDVEHVTWTSDGMKLLIERSKTDAEGEGAEIAIPRGQSPETCPVTALQQWLTEAGISSGPLFRKVNRGGAVETIRLVPDAVRQILLKRAAKI
jgi:integrase